MTLSPTSLATMPEPELSDSVHIGTGPPLPSATFQRIRQRMTLECCKWDPQVGDVSTLEPFPLLLRRTQWRYLAHCAEKLARETCDAERAFLKRADLPSRLAIPARLIEPVLESLRSQQPAVSDARVMRFDFHPTTEGWRVSEVNSDVPGGFSESSEFPSMIAEHCSGYRPAGAPGSSFADAIIRMFSLNAGNRPRAGLIFAAGFMEDLQVVSYLAQLLRKRGIETHLLNPHQLRFQNRHAFIATEGRILPLSAIVRFHQAEWLSRKRYAAIAPYLLGASQTPVVNPGHALLSESKRLPLLWDELCLPMSTWRQLLPETRDPRSVPWRRNSGWLLKSAFCNTGDSVSSRLTLSRRRWLAATAEATLLPSKWIAQRRFEACPIETPSGAKYPCLGVYTVGGRACGVYGRLSRTPLIDYAAADVGVLVEEENR